MGEGAGRRFFIALVSDRYQYLSAEDQLPRAASDVTAMAEMFEGFGYSRVLNGLGQYDGADQVKRKLGLWAADTRLDADDAVVLYFAGHGLVAEQDRHYLLCWDSREEAPASTALATEELTRILCEGDLRNLLLVLDTCAGGAGSADAAGVALRTVAYRQLGDSASGGLWFLSSARRKDTADDGAFVDCLRKALPTATNRTGQRQRFVDLSVLVGAVNEQFEALGTGQRAELVGGLVTGVAPFVPNDGFRTDLPPVGSDLEVQRRVTDRSLADHFGPRSRGVEYESEEGQYFSGRTRVLKDLVSWLSAPTDDGRGRIVTGSPGCGKSAVLGRIVALSDPLYRARSDLTEADPATIIPEGTVASPVHARHKTLEAVVTKIASDLGVDAEGAAELFQELSRRGRAGERTVIVVDALDEAGSGTAADASGQGEPRRIARELLRPMAEIVGVRLLVGSRRELLSSLGTAFALIDLDRPAHRADQDVAGYVRRVLLAADERGVRTNYRDKPELARTVGEGVARRAAGVYLVARMTARSLRTAPLVNPTRPGWDEHLPTEIGEALDDFLRRFGPDEPRVRRMLLPLAFAEGGGLPRGEIWTRLASALSATTCTEEDISWLLKEAESYVAEVTDNGRAVYRLFHQALAEHLRATVGRPSKEIQTIIVRTLEEMTGQDWFGAHPYVRDHLPTHAAAGGVLGSLIEDPGFLLACSQSSLLRALRQVTGDDALRIRSAYEQVAHRLTPEQRPSDRATSLQLSARRCGAEALADRIERLGIRLPWSARWAWWSQSGAHRILFGHTKAVTCVANGDLDGRPVAVTGSDDRTVRVWDLMSHRQIGRPLDVGVGVSAIALGDLDDYSIALVGCVDGAVQVWDISSGRLFGEPLLGHTNSITSIALDTVDAVPVVLTASYDGTARLWNLRNRTPLGEPLAEHRSSVRAAALGRLGDRPIAVTGGDDRRIRVWDLGSLLRSGTVPAPRILIGHTAAVTAIAVAEQDAKTIAIAGDDAGMLLAWNLADGQQIGEPQQAHLSYHRNNTVLSVAVDPDADPPTILTCGLRDTRRWDLRTLRQIGHPLRGHPSNLTGAALTGQARGSMAVTVSADRTARIWDLSSDQPASGHTDKVHALAYAEFDGVPYALTCGESGVARLWDLRTRSQLGPPLEAHSQAIMAAALGRYEGRIIAVTAGTDTTIRLWEAESGTPLGEPLRGHTNAVKQVKLIEYLGRQLVISGGLDGTIRIWHPSSGEVQRLRGHIGSIDRLAAAVNGTTLEIAAATSNDHVYLWTLSAEADTARLKAHLDLSEDVAITARILNVAFHRTRAIALYTREDNKLHTIDIETAAVVAEPIRGSPHYVLAAAIGHLDGRALVGATAYDTIRVCDLTDGTQLGDALHTTVYPSDAELVFCMVEGRPMALTAHDDEVRLWDLRTMHPAGEPLSGKGNDIIGVCLVSDRDPPTVVTADYFGAIRVHSLTNGRRARFQLKAPGNNFEFATAVVDGELIGVAAAVFTLRVWNIDSRRLIVEGDTRDEPGAMPIHRLGEVWTVITGTLDGAIHFRDLLTLARLGEPMFGHTAEVRSLALLATEDLLLSTSEDGTVRVWDLRDRCASGDPLTGHELGATAVCAVRVDGRRLIVTGDGRGCIRAWDLSTRQPVDFGVDSHDDKIRYLRFADLDAGPVLVVGDIRGRMTVWDLDRSTMIAHADVGTRIQDVQITPSAEICVATDMGIVLLQLNLEGSTP